MRVLLAEDSPVNKKLAVTLLEKHGHTVLTAGNGKEALDNLERLTPDAVLMDVQMPVMDGLEAIRAIRAKERQTGEHMPIVVVTAHAMKGDRERCLEAGADDYLAKPVCSRELLEALDRCAHPDAAAQPSAGQAAPTREYRTLDVRAALELVDGDRELFEELLQLFARDCPNQAAEIRGAFERGDARQLERLAHTVKGAAASLGAKGVSQAARALEEQARSKALDAAEPRIEALELKLKELLEEIEAVAPKTAERK